MQRKKMETTAVSGLAFFKDIVKGGLTNTKMNFMRTLCCV